MPYVVPQTQVFQNIAASPQIGARLRRAHISGGHAFLVRYDQTDERSLGRLGYYDQLVDQAYAWPNRPAGGVIDPDYTKVFIKDALLQYFSDAVGSGSDMLVVSGAPNKVRSSSVNFVDNGDSYPLAAALKDRGVKVGDIAKLRAIDEDLNEVVRWTSVQAIEGDEVAGVVGSAAADANNPSTQVASDVTTKTGGVANCVTLNGDATAYDAYTDGYRDETYDIIVTESSVGGDFTTARLRVISASGTDDAEDVVPAAAGDPTTIGSRGLVGVFDLDTGACSQSADDAGVTPNDLHAGQKWRIVAHGAFTKPVATAAGTYDGDVDTTYVITVTRGGKYSGTDPQITVTTTTGVDVSGPTTVAAAATPVDVGTHGVTVQFSGTGLRKGDVYTIPVTGVKIGDMRTLVFNHSLPDTVTAGTDVDVTLFIKADLQVDKNRIGDAPNVNWEQSATEITLKSGLTAFNETWTDGGTPVALPVYSEDSKGYGVAYTEYRAWLPAHVSVLGSISDVGDLDTMISGPLVQDNPLKYGVFCALKNNGGQVVHFTAVSDPADVDAWVDVLELLNKKQNIYNVVPLTSNKEVQDLFFAHVQASSSETRSKWRAAWFALHGVPEIPVVSAGSNVVGHTEPTTGDGDPCLCRIIDDPDTSGSQYTIVVCDSANGDFATNNVRAGDIVRTLYTTDGFGNESYSEYVVDAVIAEDRLRLVSGPAAPVNTAARTEVWRNLTPADEQVEIRQQAGAWGNKRVRAVWPDFIEDGTTSVAGYFLCAALAGLSSGVRPQQGLTRVEIGGFSSVQRTTNRFTDDQLDDMAGSGVWIVTQDEQTGQIFTRHAVTTADYAIIEEREEMIVRNLDDISYGFHDLYEPLIGKVNAVPSVERELRFSGTDYIDRLKVANYTNLLGGQVVDGAVKSVRRHASAADRRVVSVDLTLPAPLNNIDVVLNVTV